MPETKLFLVSVGASGQKIEGVLPEAEFQTLCGLIGNKSSFLLGLPAVMKGANFVSFSALDTISIFAEGVAKQDEAGKWHIFKQLPYDFVMAERIEGEGRNARKVKYKKPTFYNPKGGEDTIPVDPQDAKNLFMALSPGETLQSTLEKTTQILAARLIAFLPEDVKQAVLTQVKGQKPEENKGQKPEEGAEAPKEENDAF